MMKRIRLRTLIPTLLALAACGPAPDPGTVRPEDASEARSAALARVLVDNRTAHTLRIGYTLAAEPAGAVLVGTVPARDARPVAPVPAGEPIVLFARSGAVGRLVLAPRTLEIDQEWTWIVPADATFAPEPESAPR